MARILIVEDHEECRQSLVALLELWGHQVAAAAAGGEGLRIATTFRPTVAILDLGLPEIDGYELAQCLRQGDDPPYLIALTGYGSALDSERALEAGFSAFFLKPMELDELKLLLTECDGKRWLHDMRRRGRPAK